MQAIFSAQSPDCVSTAVIGSVVVCHDQGFHFLGSMVPDTSVASAQVYMQTDPAVPRWMFDPGHGLDTRDAASALSSSPRQFSAPVPEPGPEDLEDRAVRHLRELMRRARDGKMRYLSDAGMDKESSANLVSLVVSWLDEAGLERLGDLSRVAVQRDLGPGHVLERWINGLHQLRLALLLDAESVDHPDLAAAYAVSHAADLVLASYQSDLVADNGVLPLVAGDDLD